MCVVTLRGPTFIFAECSRNRTDILGTHAHTHTHTCLNGWIYTRRLARFRMGVQTAEQWPRRVKGENGPAHASNCIRNWYFPEWVQNPKDRRRKGTVRPEASMGQILQETQNKLVLYFRKEGSKILHNGFGRCTSENGPTHAINYMRNWYFPECAQNQEKMPREGPGPAGGEHGPDHPGNYIRNLHSFGSGS